MKFNVKRKYKKDPREVVIYFGIPGSGKTTIASALARRSLKRGERVFSNVPILGALELDANNDLGEYLVEDGLIILDEAGIEFNSRNYKSLKQNIIKFAKLHRHYNTRIVMFSQDFEDMDITFRRLASKFIIVRKSYIPFFIFTRQLQKYIGLDEEGQIICKYRFKFLGFKWYFAPKYWKYFDTYEAPFLPSKEWNVFNHKNRYSDSF